MKKYFKYVTVKRLVLSFLIFTFLASGLTYAFTQSATVNRNQKDWLKRGGMYVEYDFGSWLPNDDAWLKAEINSSSYQTSICEAWAGGKHAVDTGRRAIVELSGVDYFDSGSYSKTKNSEGQLYLRVR
ncbi:hypothetical protein [Kallipyga massiliensis]|uniref:hypothetical protein n=1 Tax=Kallipyga massiliensis TaxID=1472764 RepID=UPI00055F826F|nr:hypothetical protein [Kallipyga massiliensis]